MGTVLMTVDGLLNELRTMLTNTSLQSGIGNESNQDSSGCNGVVAMNQALAIIPDTVIALLSEQIAKKMNYSLLAETVSSRIENEIIRTQSDLVDQRVGIHHSFDRISQQLSAIKRIEDKIDQQGNGIGLLPIEVAAPAIGKSVERVRHLCYENKIANVKKGNSLYFRPEWLADYIQSGEYHKKLI